MNLKGFYGMSVNPKAMPRSESSGGNAWSKGQVQENPGCKTDAKGNVKLKFVRGTYYVTAKGYIYGQKREESKTVKCPIMAPACKVKVTK